MKIRDIAIFLVILAITASVSFEGGSYYAWVNRPRTLHVFFGSVAEVPVREIIGLYEAKTGVKIEPIFGSSGSLLSSMEVAKVGDIYAPDSLDFMYRANEAAVTNPDSVKILAYMIPAIIVPKGNPKNIASLEDLAKAGVRVAIADPQSVAIGAYAAELLEVNNLTSKESLWKAVKPNIVAYADSTSSLASIVAGGSVDAAIGWSVMGYWDTSTTDIVMINATKIPRIAYIPAAISTYTEDLEKAQDFLNYLVSSDAQAVFERDHYFTTVAEAQQYAPNALVEQISSSLTTVTPLRVFAAASLVFALQDLQASFERNYSASLIYNFAGSQALSQQILLGSPADVFISANTKEMIRVQNGSLLADNNTYSILLYNYLAVYVPADNPANITTLADLLKPGVRIVVEDPSVPAGAYTVQIWQKIQSTWGNKASKSFKSLDYANYSSRITKNVVSYTLDVESAVQMVLTGGADAGFAYASDAVPRGAQLKLIPIPPEVNVKATYTIGVISLTAYPNLAHQFVNYLLSKDGQALLAKWGFTPAH
jgi:molybdate transport system substrate-binding protein